MKKIQIIIILLICNIGYTQNPVLNIHTDDLGKVDGAYYKDMDNFYDQFVGTWVYTDATKTIRFRFIKKVMFPENNLNLNYFYDVLVGEMQFIENGVEKINSLNNLNTNYNSIFKYNLNVISRVGKHKTPKCHECPNFSKTRLEMDYDEPQNDDSGLAALFLMRRADEYNIPKIKVQYRFYYGAIGSNKNENIDHSTTENFLIPYGDYILTKE